MKKTLLIISSVLLLFGCVTKGKYTVMDAGKQKENELKEVREITNEVFSFELPAVTSEITAEVKPVTEETKIIAKKEITAEKTPGIVQEKQKEVQVVTSTVKPKKSRKINYKEFGVGEKFEFAVQYLGITAATASFEIKEKVSIEGEPAYRLVSNAKVVPLLASVYRVDDTVESFIDVKGLYTRKLYKKIIEGNYENETTQYYDQNNGLVKEGDKLYNIPEFCQDVFSAFYFFRAHQLAVGRNIDIAVYADGKVNKLTASVLRKEKIRTPLGRYEAYAVRPFMNFESIFKQEGEVTVWVSVEEPHIPLMMKSKAFVGSINAVLINVVVPK
ncbi:MAG: hypothetical protein A2452_05970 [Candidatus Firestonebacteria bacterium RIFOXYC2_FULL_39_67]|nr:MAG: hypothetical protein A2536_12495 [Candidatus Firestonebacteria bacterium RIFOXYD2_FULL_39_29]OGF56634.1 MAG: hypothetical protein A2452_05970 [Candidatus Firestonebacteria bacterium RIFOXYC2_FULL_39_67]OGF57110.1 MAG: hypothetical protein A2497_04515 [Candidatus Firestonebacteria bacterium RifOxyC12_full_39_7]